MTQETGPTPDDGPDDVHDERMARVGEAIRDAREAADEVADRQDLGEEERRAAAGRADPGSPGPGR